MQANGVSPTFQPSLVTSTEPAAQPSSRVDQVMKRSLSLSSSTTSLDPDPKRREVNPVTAQEALVRLYCDVEDLSVLQLMQKLSEFTRTMRNHWDSSLADLPDGSIFVNICSPPASRLASTLHANWLDDKRSFAAVMYPSLICREAFLETLYANRIALHAHLANDFVVWLQHPETGPLFPMNSGTFQMLQGERTIVTEIGEIRIGYGAITALPSGQLYGTVLLSGVVGEKLVTRTVEWPLDFLELNNGVKILSTLEADSYLYVDREQNLLHKLTLIATLWRDFEGISPLELHRLALQMVSAQQVSSGCRAGVGRTGTLFCGNQNARLVKGQSR